MVSLILADQGIETRHESTVEAALEQLASRRFDLIISDIGLPSRNGYELIRKLRELEIGERTPAIALTALAQKQDREKAFAAGFDEHLAKPLRPLALLSVNSRLLPVEH